MIKCPESDIEDKYSLSDRVDNPAEELRVCKVGVSLTSMVQGRVLEQLAFGVFLVEEGVDEHWPDCEDDVVDLAQVEFVVT